MDGHPEGRVDGSDRARREESLLTSLSELRAIERARQAEERAATEAAVVAERRAQEAAAQLVRDTEAARHAAEIAAQLAAELARADAERRDWVRIEAAEAVERARRLVELDERSEERGGGYPAGSAGRAGGEAPRGIDERRLAEDIALRREAAMRQRPRWMIALSVGAVLAAGGVGCLAADRQRELIAARHDRDRALDAQTAARAAIGDALAERDQLRRELDELKAIVGRPPLTPPQPSALDRDGAPDSAPRVHRKSSEPRHDRPSPDGPRPTLVIPARCLNNPLCK